jgi:hypothetical protein
VPGGLTIILKRTKLAKFGYQVIEEGGIFFFNYYDYYKSLLDLQPTFYLLPSGEGSSQKKLFP